VSKQVEAVNDLRTMTTADLDEHLRQQRRRLFEVRFQQAAGQVENHRQVRELRREIARTMTIQLELARGHHLVSDLEVEEEPEEQPHPRRLLRRRPTAVPAGEVVDAELVDAELVDAGAAAAEPVGDAGSDDAGAAEPEPATKPRRPRRVRVAAAPVAEAAGDGSEIADEGATGPDEEQTDE
jgi:large subunit ribosomal protein L29